MGKNDYTDKEYEKLNKIRIVANHVREAFGKNDITGKCIVCTDKIVDILKANGIKAEAKQVWVLYECFEGCPAVCYEEHWITKAYVGSHTIYADATLDQFQWAFRRKLPKIFIGEGLPGFMLSREPGRETLKKCGWTDWYNKGDYECNFDYYSNFR